VVWQTVAGLYSDFLSPQEQTITNAMGAILKPSGGRGDISVIYAWYFKKGV